VWMPPEVWLPLVWNCSEPEWLNQDEAARVCGTVLSRHDQVARQLADDPDSYAPIFRTLPDGTVAADDWARGFLDGTALCAREWDALDRDPRAKRFLVTITAQLPDRDEEIMADLGQEPCSSSGAKGATSSATPSPRSSASGRSGAGPARPVGTATATASRR
jgi:yecA family protein